MLEPVQNALFPPESNGADIMIFDANSAGYAAVYQPALARLVSKGRPIAGLHGALASLLSVMDKNPGGTPVVVWDGHAKWRRELFEGYKAGRTANPEKLAIRRSYEQQVPFIQMMMLAMGVPQVRCGSAEADDVGGVLCRHLDPSWSIDLHTRDYDWLQGLREGTCLVPPGDKPRISLADLSNPDNGLPDGHFLSPREFICAKALAGDGSDEIPGIEGVGLKTAAKIMRSAGGTIEEFWAKADSGEKVTGVVAKRVAEAESRAIYARNLKLMDWTLAPPLDTSCTAITAGRPDWPEIESIAKEFGLTKILQRCREVLQDNPNWRPAVTAVDRAIHHEHCQPYPKPGR